MQQQAMVINGAVPAVQHVRPAAEEAGGEVKGSNVTEQGRSSSTPQSPSSAAGGCAGHVDRLLLQNRCARLPAAVMPVPTAAQSTLDFLLLLPLPLMSGAGRLSALLLTPTTLSACATSRPRSTCGLAAQTRACLQTSLWDWSRARCVTGSAMPWAAECSACCMHLWPAPCIVAAL